MEEQVKYNCVEYGYCTCGKKLAVGMTVAPNQRHIIGTPTWNRQVQRMMDNAGKSCPRCGSRATHRPNERRVLGRGEDN